MNEAKVGIVPSCHGENGGTTLLGIARECLSAGLCVLPARADKTPALPLWKDFQSGLPGADEVDEWFGNPRRQPHGLGFVCGQVSGGLEVLDLDAKHDPTVTLIARSEATIKELAPGLWERAVIEKTPSGGLHLYFRCPHPAKNLKLAYCLNAEGKRMAVAETRGEGGFIVASPTPGYVLINGRLSAPPLFTDDERSALFAAARSLDTAPVPKPEEPAAAFNRAARKDFPADFVAPGEAYNATDDWKAVVIEAGWKEWREKAWRRPGKTEGNSASWDRYGNRLLHVFTPNSPPLEDGQNYSPFALYAFLKCGGDFKLAAQKLYDLGYGTRRKLELAAPSAAPNPDEQAALDEQNETAFNPAGGSGETMEVDDGDSPNVQSSPKKAVPTSLKGHAASEPPEPALPVLAATRSNEPTSAVVSKAGGCTKSDYTHLAKEFGIPFQTGKTSIRLNQPFFAARFANENKVLFESEEQRFYLYNAQRGLWQQTTVDKIKTMLLADLMEFSRTEKSNLRERFELARTDQYASSVARLLRGQVEQRRVFSNPRRIVHVLNGVVEISRTGIALRAFAPDYYSRNQLPVSYDPKAKCPRFLDELLRPALPDDDIRLLQKWLGGVLLGGNLAQKILVQHGRAGGGKGTFAHVVGKLIGEENFTQLRTELLHERFEIARYASKRLLSGVDVPGDFLNRRGASVLKALSGGDDLDGEIKGSMDSTRISHIDQIITANSSLHVRLEGDADAWRRRLLIVRFDQAPPAKPIPEFHEELFREEGSGILNWAMEGAIVLLNELKVYGRFLMTVEQIKRVDDLLAESDSVGAFLREKLVACDGSDVTSDELCERYTRYCEEMDWRPLSRREVERMLPDLMLKLFNTSKRHDVKRLGKSNKGYVGVKIQEGTEPITA